MQMIYAQRMQGRQDDNTKVYLHESAQAHPLPQHEDPFHIRGLERARDGKSTRLAAMGVIATICAADSLNQARRVRHMRGVKKGQTATLLASQRLLAKQPSRKARGCSSNLAASAVPTSIPLRPSPATLQYHTVRAVDATACR